MSVVAFGSERPELDGRLQGGGFGNCPASQSTDFYFNFVENTMFNGLEFYAWDSNKGDKISFLTEYTIDGGTTWLRYKKTAKDWYVLPNCKSRLILFPTYPSAGVRIKMTYHNVGANAVDFAFNVFKYVDVQPVDPTQGQQGEDW